MDAALGLGTAHGGRRAAALAAGLGIAGAALQLALYWRRPAPLAEPSAAEPSGGTG